MIFEPFVEHGQFARGDDNGVAHPGGMQDLAEGKAGIGPQLDTATQSAAEPRTKVRKGFHIAKISTTIPCFWFRLNHDWT